MLEVEAHDDAAGALTATLARIEGTSVVPIPLEVLGGGVFRAVMPHACDEAGPFNALITVTDAAGNELREWLAPAFACRPATCGNGTLDAGEACDDGNLLPEDGCNAACSSTETCGDGVLDVGEACDDGNGVGGDCCSATCQAETAATTCDDGAFCNGSDRCDAAGSCARHGGSPCAGEAECNIGCDEAQDACMASAFGTACGADANACTDDVCNGAGACTHPFNTAPCDDGTYCNGADTCSGGACDVHAGDPCPTAGECVGACDEAARSCFAPWGTPCTDDGELCTWDSCNGAGACAHVASFPGVVCREATDPCDVPEACTGMDATCPADTGITDTDGDALCDGLDPCTNVAHGRDFVSPPVAKLVLGNTFVDVRVGNDTLALRGVFTLPPSVAFWQLFPQGAEARVVLRSAAGVAVVDVGLPNELYSSATKRGWSTSRNGRQWTWRDRNDAPLGGIKELAVRLLGAIDEVGARVRLAVAGRAGDFPFVAADVPVNASITLGGVPAAAGGRCAESAFAPADCTMGSQGTKLTCKR